MIWFFFLIKYVELYSGMQLCYFLFVVSIQCSLHSEVSPVWLVGIQTVPSLQWDPVIVWLTVFCWFFLQLCGVSKCVQLIVQSEIHLCRWLYAALSSVLFCSTNSSHHGLPELWSLFPQLSDISGLWVSLPGMHPHICLQVASSHILFFFSLACHPWAGYYIWKWLFHMFSLVFLLFTIRSQLSEWLMLCGQKWKSSMCVFLFIINLL